MKNLKVLFAILIFSLFALSSCSDDNSGENLPVQQGSVRDWTYSGDRLTVNLNGNAVINVKQAQVNSTFAGTKQEGEVRHLLYKSTVTISGFPTADATTVLTTDMIDNQSFAGTTTIGNVTYNYQGTFTGDQLDNYSKQGLVINFTSQK